MEKSEMLFAALIVVVVADIIFNYMKSQKLKQENSILKDQLSKCKEDYASLTRTVVMSDVDKFSNEKTIRDLEQQLANALNR
jgi:hypothetical protein